MCYNGKQTGIAREDAQGFGDVLCQLKLTPNFTPGLAGES